MLETNGKHAISSSNSLLSGSFSGVVAAVVTQPFDVARTMLQRDSRDVQHRSTWASWQYIVRTQGITGLWRGNVASALRVGGGAGMYFAVLNQFTKFLSPSSGGIISEAKLGWISTFLVGFSARASVSILLLPLTVIKTRMEAGDRRYGGFFMTLRGIAKSESPAMLFRGTLPTVLRDAPFSGLYLIFYRRIKSMLSSLSFSSHWTLTAVNFAAGVTAGAIATAITNPADVIRTRMQLAASPASSFPSSSHPAAAAADASAPRPRPASISRLLPAAGGASSLQVARAIVAAEGWTALLTLGLGPRVFKRSLQAALTWTFYEEMVRWVRSRGL